MPHDAQAKPYHHGDLRSALLSAAWSIIKEEGISALTLRACARRAGVSHAAPSHHFGNLAGLLGELAADGFEQLVRHMDAVEAKGDGDALRAAGTGYIQFAINNTEAFKVMTAVKAAGPGSARFITASEHALNRLKSALSDAYTQLNEQALDAETLHTRSALAWACVHGYAALVVDGVVDQQAFPGVEQVLEQLRPALLSS